MGTIAGTEGADSLTGTNGVDTISGLGGNDTLDGGLGDDILNGGAGIDTASYEDASGSITVQLDEGTVSGADGNDTLISIERVIGSAFNDFFVGTSNGVEFHGGEGNDNLYGG